MLDTPKRPARPELHRRVLARVGRVEGTPIGGRLHIVEELLRDRVWVRAPAFGHPRRLGRRRLHILSSSRAKGSGSEVVSLAVAFARRRRFLLRPRFSGLIDLIADVGQVIKEIEEVVKEFQNQNEVAFG